MKLLKEILETAMVAAFLKAELPSARFGDELKKAMNALGVAESIISEPNVENETENELRARVLGSYRGYRQNRQIFQGFPADLSWYEAELAREEIGGLHYVDYSYWNELSDHTHLVKNAVANINKGKIIFNMSNDRFLAVAEDIRHGQHDFEPMIVWGESKAPVLTILEGHLRATAFGLAGENAPATIKVIVGLSDQPQ
ncbi:MAG TPA: hypothetical protein VGO07_03905 [Candidatus Saccharimonadales bacterium]|jgi:hypothetical protein|nr:hypothetical protein [Candidatus Saccharimonadales bacterium]